MARICPEESAAKPKKEEMTDNTSTKKVLVVCANGSEDVETITIVDVLRRVDPKLCSVTLAGLSNPITLVRGCIITCDKILEDIDENSEWDAIIVPGGMAGSKALSESSQLIRMLRKQSM